MGHFDSNANHVVQELDSAIGGIWGTAGYFDGQLFYGGNGDHLKAFQVSNGQLSTSPTSQSTHTFQFPGTLPTVSANGTSGGIVWALDTGFTNSPAVLLAYDATNLGLELYNSSSIPNQDQAGLAVHFASPTVADGKVYVGASSELDVYGLLPIDDPSFEQVQVGAGQYQYRPTGSSWTFVGNSGISGNYSVFTGGNPLAPQGVQVAFLQTTGSFSQSVAGWAAGSYTLSFSAAQRGNSQASRQDFQVLVDGVVVGTFTPSGTTYQTYTTSAFSVAAGSHTITFQGLDSAGGDNTAFVDAVALANVSPTDDAGFEQVQVGAGQYQYRPTGSPWSFSGNSGISANNSGFTSGNPPAPEGTQVAFLQTTGSFSQSVAGWAAGSYVLTFDAAQRGNYQASQQDFEVLIDGTVISTFTPSNTSYQTYTTVAFTVTAGSHTIKFQGLDSAGGDNTAFVDAVAIQ
jgi:hypothetical protein